MAKQATVSFPTSSSNGSFVRADAFLNLTLVDNSGNEFRLPKGIPLHLTRSLDSNLISAAKENPDLVFTLTGTIAVVDSESTTVPNFG